MATFDSPGGIGIESFRDFPVFTDIGNVGYASWSAISAQHDPQSDSMIRTVRIMSPGIYDLKECLDITDRELEMAASYCGARVVAHTWGLVPSNRALRAEGIVGSKRYEDRLLPEGFLLAAQTELIDQCTVDGKGNTIEEKEALVGKGLEKYINSGGILGDLFARQFTIGKSRATETTGLFLHDIEPLMVSPGISKRFTARGKNILQTKVMGKTKKWL